MSERLLLESTSKLEALFRVESRCQTISLPNYFAERSMYLSNVVERSTKNVQVKEFRFATFANL